MIQAHGPSLPASVVIPAEEACGPLPARDPDHEDNGALATLLGFRV